VAVSFTYYTSRPRVIEDEGAQISGYAAITTYTAGGELCSDITRRFKTPWAILFERDVAASSNFFVWDRAANTIMILQASGAEATAGVSATAYFVANGLAHLSWSRE